MTQPPVFDTGILPLVKQMDLNWYPREERPNLI